MAAERPTTSIEVRTKRVLHRHYGRLVFLLGCGLVIGFGTAWLVVVLLGLPLGDVRWLFLVFEYMGIGMVFGVAASNYTRTAANPWPNDRILRLWEDLRQELNVPADHAFGAALWTVFSNNERVIDADGAVVDVGSWRHAGVMVATLCGGEYMDYYMSNAEEELVARARAALARKGFTFTDFDEWIEGCLAGRYKIPPSWADYFRKKAR